MKVREIVLKVRYLWIVLSQYSSQSLFLWTLCKCLGYCPNLKWGIFCWGKWLVELLHRERGLATKPQRSSIEHESGERTCPKRGGQSPWPPACSRGDRPRRRPGQTRSCLDASHTTLLAQQALEPFGSSCCTLHLLALNRILLLLCCTDVALMLVTCSVVPCSALHCCVQADQDHLLCTYTSVNCSQQPASAEEPTNLPGEMPVLATLWKKDSMNLEKHHIC